MTSGARFLEAKLHSDPGEVGFDNCESMVENPPSKNLLTDVREFWTRSSWKCGYTN